MGACVSTPRDADLDAFASAEDAATHLVRAAGKGDTAGVLTVLRSGLNPDVTPTSTQGGTALHIACLYGHTDVVACLLEAKASVDCRDAVGATPLFAASLKGHSAVVDLLLAGQGERRSDVAAGTDDGTTALHAAAAEGHTSVVAALLRAGAPAHALTHDGSVPAHLAAARGQADALKLLLEAPGASPEVKDSRGATPLHAASMYGTPAAVAVLLSKKAAHSPRTKRGTTPLSLAAKRGEADIARRLLAAGADATEPDGRGMQPLLHAASRGHGATVAVLVKQPGVKPDAMSPDGYTALLLAAFGGHTEAVTALLAGGANPNWKPPPARKRGAGPSSVGPSSQAPADASVSLDGWTPLLVAAQQGSAGVVSALLAQGALPNTCLPEDGTTPLMLAAQNGHSGAMKALLAGGAKVNAVDVDGATALHCAVLRVRAPSDVDCVRLLLSSGADPLAAAVSGETPLEMATELPGAVGEDVRRALGAAVARTDGGKGKKSVDVSDSLSEAGSGSSSRSDGRPPGSPRKRFAAPQLGAIPSLEL